MFLSVKFYQCGKRVASSNHNFVIFGANCEEMRERQFIHNNMVSTNVRYHR